MERERQENMQHPEASGGHSSTADALMAVSMLFGRGPAARLAVEAGRLSLKDRVVDIGCGPGTAIRVASRQCDEAIGVDPSAASLRLGRMLNRIRRNRNAILLEGKAEALPISDGHATVVWALSSFHHWADQAGGLAEAKRVLEPGGRLMVLERLVKPVARGHALHGLTPAQLDDAKSALVEAGFTDVSREQRDAGRTTWSIVRGVMPAT